MFVAFTSPTGGCGTTTAAAAFALHCARRHPAGAVFVDLAGDGPVVLGMPEPADLRHTAWTDWPQPQIEVPVTDAPKLTLVPNCVVVGPERLAAKLAGDTRPIIVDCGKRPVPGSPGQVMLDEANWVVMVMRPCYIAARRAGPMKEPDVLAVMQEPGRVLTSTDLGAALDAPAVVDLPHSTAIARTVDSGLLVGRPPTDLQKALAEAAPLHRWLKASVARSQAIAAASADTPEPPGLSA